MSHHKPFNSLRFIPPIIRTIFHDDFGRILHVTMQAPEMKSRAHFVVHKWLREDQTAFAVLGTFASREAADLCLNALDEFDCPWMTGEAEAREFDVECNTLGMSDA